MLRLINWSQKVWYLPDIVKCWPSNTDFVTFIAYACIQRQLDFQVYPDILGSRHEYKYWTETTGYKNIWDSMEAVEVEPLCWQMIVDHDV